MLGNEPPRCFRGNRALRGILKWGLRVAKTLQNIWFELLPDATGLKYGSCRAHYLVGTTDDPTMGNTKVTIIVLGNSAPQLDKYFDTFLSQIKTLEGIK